MEDQVVVQTQEQVTPTPSPFAQDAWSEVLPEVTQPTQEQPTVTQEQPKPTEVVSITTEVEEILDPKDWLKRELEVDDIAIIKAEREEYRKLKETKPEELKFENEQSKQIFELLKEGKSKEVKKFLETQERLEQYTSAEVNETTADDIIKMGMQLRYKDLSPSEIEYKFKKEFSVPKEPVQLVDELDEDFSARKAEWQEKVNDIKMNKIIEAKLARPELEKAKANLVLPEITKPTQQANEPDPVLLQQARDKFLQALESNYSKVEGFVTKVKDESVEIPVSFKIPDEDKVAIKGRLQEGMDVNAYMDNRWFDQSGNPKVEQIITDLYQLENLDKILSGVANNSANKRVEAYIKEKSNIDVTSKTSQQTFDPTKSGNQTVSPFAKDAWSEKPPVYQN